MRYKSGFDNPKFMARRARVLARDPSLRSCYPWCTPEDEAEFYAAIERGTEKYGLALLSSCPDCCPCSAAASGTKAAAGRATPARSARSGPVRPS